MMELVNQLDTGKSMSLSSGQWYTDATLQILDEVVTGQKFLAVSMIYDAEAQVYAMQELDIFDAADCPMMLRQITSNADMIYNEILFNLNILCLYQDTNLLALRYLDVDYLARFFEHGLDNRSEGESPIVCIEPLYWTVQSSDIIPNEYISMVLWQDNEMLRLMLQSFAEKSQKQNSMQRFVVYSGLDDQHQIYHLFVCIPNNIHPEMVFPVLVGYTSC